MRKTLFAAAVVLAGGLQAATASDKLKVGFVYLGPVGDFGWTYQHEVGHQELVKALGDEIETTYLENVNEGPDSERAIEQLVRAGNKLIFTTSFGYMDPTLKVAKKYPNVHFEHATGFKRDKNMATYSARWYQGRYIQGQIAARMSKKGVIGYIGSFPIPEVVSGINATLLGAQSINPNIKFKIIWANSWFDPGKEADAAKALLDQGADIITQHTDSPAAVQIASERGAMAFGQDSDMIKFGPKTQLTAIVDNWAPYYIERIKSQLDGSWKAGDTWGGLDSKMFVMAPYTNMPDDVKKQAEDTEAALAKGTLHPFKCPLAAQDGKALECKDGDHLADGQILSMNYYLKGIDDKLPGK
ncbi:BMP family ABC transporter substrate-binding protein [Bradyrhizobium sp. WD16]|uniref:BMP family ABC transporter substrate-binding protein n=1 Tax=Bradyrhizobium sp. WD16 TaxID=1521768 RepID=UPI0035326FD8